MLLDVSFICGCGRENNHSVHCPEPDYEAERNIDSGRSTEDFVSCPHCKAEHRVSITTFQQSMDCFINDGDIPAVYDMPYFDRDYTDQELAWLITSSPDSPLEVFRSQLASVDSILSSNMKAEAKFSLHVMVFAHVVAAIEGYLSATFIQLVSNSTMLTRRLVETDPVFRDRTVTFSEIFKTADSIKVTVGAYLQDLIFHNLQKIKPMYLSVLSIDFGEVAWLFRAVKIRHDCVHRAGYAKDGSRVDVSHAAINDLMQNAELLVGNIEVQVHAIKSELDNPWGAPF